MKNNNDLIKLSFYDEEIKEQFNNLDSEVLDFIKLFIENNNFNKEVIIARVNQTKLSFKSILCKINNEYYDIFFTDKYINVEGRETRLCYKKENGYILEDKTYKLDNGSSFIYKKHFPYNLIFAFQNGKSYKVHLECNIDNIDQRIVEYFHNNIPYVKRINDLLKILLSLVDIDNSVIEIKNNQDNLLFEKGILKEYNEYFEKDNIKYHIYLKDNEVYVDKEIIKTEKINKEDIIDIKKYKKVI